MQYTDRVYGSFKITEPVILELINSSAIQRLKGIDHAGYRHFWKELTESVPASDYTRFTHSMGVYYLLRKYGASLEEQISGLIHDVSHSAFSHCIDYVFKSCSEKTQSYQDDIFDSFVRKTDIPAILKKYGFDLDYILDDKHFLLKERDLPDLCADRIDYSLRTAVVAKEISDEEKEYFLKNLETEDNKWVFKNFISAKKYAELFFSLDKKYFSGLPSAAMLRSVGDYLRYALQKGYILENELYTTDQEVIEKINLFLAKDKKLKLFWDRMNGKIKVSDNPDDYNVSVFCKSRLVDPLFKEKKSLKRLSEVDLKWKDRVKFGLKPKQHFLKFGK